MAPSASKHVIEAVFPGLAQKTINKIEETFETKSLTNLEDKITQNPSLSKFVTAISTLITMETKYIDLFKDTFLAVIVLITAGGPDAVYNFPTNFTSCVVMALFLHILTPILVQSLHLAINNPLLIFNRRRKTHSVSERVYSTISCILFGFMSPLLLLNNYFITFEKLKHLSRSNHSGTKIVELAEHCQAIRLQIVEFLKIELGFELFYQITAQALLLLKARTETPTVGGLETMFNQPTTFLGVEIEPQVALFLSIIWSLKTCIFHHLKAIVGNVNAFFPTKAKILILLWGLFGALRRVLSLIMFFTPSLGLFHILYHWKAELIPYKIRQEYAKKIKISPDDKIGLYGLNETVLWSELDRWNYEDSEEPSPPHYHLYTGLALKGTVVAFMVVTTLHFFIVFMAKLHTSERFRRQENWFNKLVHVYENVNVSLPFEDWSSGIHSTEEYKLRYQRGNKEMAWAFSVNISFSFLMMCPLYYTGKLPIKKYFSYNARLFILAYNISSRHWFLKSLVGTKKEEEISYERIMTLVISVTTMIIVFSILEVAFFFIYNSKVVI